MRFKLVEDTNKFSDNYKVFSYQDISKVRDECVEIWGTLDIGHSIYIRNSDGLVIFAKTLNGMIRNKTNKVFGKTTTKNNGDLHYTDYVSEQPYNVKPQYEIANIKNSIGHSTATIKIIDDNGNVISQVKRDYHLQYEPELTESILDESSIDPDGKYTDYGTGKVTSDNIFDDRTHVSFYDQLFTNPDYMEEKENLKGHIEMISPKEYYEICATKIFPNSSVESLKRSRAADPRVLDEIKEIIVKYKRQVFLPYLNYAEQNQEGLHRMLVAAELFGWDHKFPVLIIEWADEELAQKRLKEKEQNRIRLKIKDAVQKSLHYTYDNLEEFEEETRAQVDYVFDFADEKVNSYSVRHNDDETTDVEVNNVVYQFDTELINISPRPTSDDLDDIDLDDIELDDIELDDLDMDEFLKKYGIG